MNFFSAMARRVRAWVRGGLAKAVTALYDGPRTPDRALGFTKEFIRYYPHATRAEWMTFTLRMAEEMYRSGYIRGREEGIAEGRALPPPDDEKFNWQWNIPQPQFSKPFMNDAVPEADPLPELGYSDEERAYRHAWRQQLDRARMVADSGGEDPPSR